MVENKPVTWSKEGSTGRRRDRVEETSSVFLEKFCVHLVYLRSETFGLFGFRNDCVFCLVCFEKFS